MTRRSNPQGAVTPGRPSVLLVALSGLFAATGCARPFAGFDAVEHEGFRIEIVSVRTTTIARGPSGALDHQLFITAKVDDVAKQRVATVEHRLHLTEVRGDRGQDLLGSSSPEVRHAGNDAPTHPMFLTPEAIERGRGFTYRPTGYLKDLPETPRLLRRVAGYARLLVATSVVSGEFSAVAGQGGEVVPECRVQITRVEERPGSVSFAYRMRIENTDSGYDESLPPFLYLVELLDETGTLVERYNGRPMIQNTATGVASEERLVRLDPPGRRIATVRVTVVAEVEVLDLPFLVENVPLE